jgi:general secretion pathway protein I
MKIIRHFSLNCEHDLPHGNFFHPDPLPSDGRGRRRLAHSGSAGRGSGTRGFTLLEVLVALAIMAIATTLVIQLFSADLRAIARSGDMTSAAVRGDSRIREILAEPSLEESTWSEQTSDGYRIDIAVSEVMKPRTNNLPVKLMEINLTIRWIEGLKEKSLRLKTMKAIEKAVPAGKGPSASA